MIELLESRIAPAAVFSYTDVAGNKVTIVTSKGTDADLAAAAGNITSGQLKVLNLQNSAFSGANVTITAVPQHGSGDGLADIGEIAAAGVNLGVVTVHGDLDVFTVGNGVGTAVKSLNVVSIGLLGANTGLNAFGIEAVGGIGALNVKTDVVGAEISATGSIGPVTIGGSFIGNDVSGTGYLTSTGNMGVVRIGGDLIAGPAELTGTIFCQGSLAGVTVGGSVTGNSSYNATGVIVSTGNMGPVRIGHDVTGAGGFESGFIGSGIVTIGFALSSEISANISSVTIGGSLIGGSVTGSGAITSSNNMGPVKIGGSIIGGPAKLAGNISSEGALSSLTVDGNITGESGFPVLIDAGGPTVHSATADVAIGGINVGGDLSYVNIEAGYSNSTAFNAEAQIGAVHVAGDWLASNLVAGVDNPASNNGDFGNANDAVITTGAKIVSRIASIVIGGLVEGTFSSVSNSDHFGFVAQTIGSFSVGGVAIPLARGPAALLYPLGVTGDVDIHELGS
jgi:hypothetical protein